MLPHVLVGSTTVIKELTAYIWGEIQKRGFRQIEFRR